MDACVGAERMRLETYAPAPWCGNSDIGWARGLPRDDDEVPAPAPRSAAGRGATPRAGASRAGARPAPPTVGSSVFLRLVATVSLVVAAVACAWAWQLEERLTQTGFELERYEERIGELEARLSDTDEGLSQNTAAMAVKIKELYSEVDKLWASAWRRNKARLDEIEGTNSNQGESLAALKKDVAAANSDLARLKGVAGDLERLMANAKANQAQVERVADTLNRLDLEMSRLAKRVEKAAPVVDGAFGGMLTAEPKVGEQTARESLWRWGRSWRDHSSGNEESRPRPSRRCGIVAPTTVPRSRATLPSAAAATKS